MSEPSRAPATARPGALSTGHNLIGNIGTGTATGACSGLANGVNGDPTNTGVNRAAAPTAAQINTHTG